MSIQRLHRIFETYILCIRLSLHYVALIYSAHVHMVQVTHKFNATHVSCMSHVGAFKGLCVHACAFVHTLVTWLYLCVNCICPVHLQWSTPVCLLQNLSTQSLLLYLYIRSTRHWWRIICTKTIYYHKREQDS